MLAGVRTYSRKLYLPNMRNKCQSAAVSVEIFKIRIRRIDDHHTLNKIMYWFRAHESCIAYSCTYRMKDKHQTRGEEMNENISMFPAFCISKNGNRSSKKDETQTKRSLFLLPSICQECVMCYCTYRINTIKGLTI
jgi:hypothetical protein